MTRTRSLPGIVGAAALVAVLLVGSTCLMVIRDGQVAGEWYWGNGAADEPLGMAQSSMTADGAGNTLTFMGMQSTCPDLARFGHLMLNAGRWDGEQVVTAEWVSEATGAPSTELNAAYGYLWWLNREGPIGGATQAVGADDDEAEEGQMVADAPEDMFWALGLGNQVVQVDPGSSTVVVRLGGASGPDDVSPFDTEAASRVVTEALVD
jgi:CubicO group peptidase (beta-lactamase class C family)